MCLELARQPSSGKCSVHNCWLVGCLTSQQHASVSQGRICEDKFTCCHTEIEVADQTFYLTQSQYTDTGPTSLSADPITPGAWQGSHWSANFAVTGMTRPRKNPGASGIRTRDLPLSRRTPYHKANEAVTRQTAKVGQVFGSQATRRSPLPNVLFVEMATDERVHAAQSGSARYCRGPLLPQPVVAATRYCRNQF